jgi:predicted ATP-dependent serine protease
MLSSVEFERYFPKVRREWTCSGCGAYYSPAYPRCPKCGVSGGIESPVVETTPPAECLPVRLCDEDRSLIEEVLKRLAAIEERMK